VSVYDSFSDGEPQTAAAGGPGTGLIHAVKTFKNKGQVFCRDAFSGIGYADKHFIILMPAGYRDAAAFGGVGYRVIQQVTQNLPDTQGVYIYQG
jgi:hypothetical protein